MGGKKYVPSEELVSKVILPNVLIQILERRKRRKRDSILGSAGREQELEQRGGKKVFTKKEAPKQKETRGKLGRGRKRKRRQKKNGAASFPEGGAAFAPEGH